MLKINRVQNLISDFTKYVYNCQNIEIDDYINFVLIVLINNVQMMFFVVVVVIVLFALVVSIVFFLVELITISFKIELLAIFARRVKFFVANNTYFDDDNNSVFNF
jgi:hypothetical protein